MLDGPTRGNTSNSPALRQRHKVGAGVGHGGAAGFGNHAYVVALKGGFEHGGHVGGRRVLVEDAESERVDVDAAVAGFEKTPRRAQLLDHKIFHGAHQLDVALRKHLPHSTVGHKRRK